MYAILDALPECIAVCSAVRDGDGRIVDFRFEHLNPTACASNQMPLEAQVGRGLLELLPAHRATGLFDAYVRVVETGEPFTTERVLFDDHYAGVRLRRWFDVRVGRHGDGIVAAWHETTARRAEEAEARRPALLLDQGSDAAFAWSADGRLAYWSSAAERLYGHRAAEVAGRVVHELLRTRFPCPFEEIQAALERDGRWDGRLEHRTAGGARVLVDSRMRAVHDEAAGPLVLETARDVTEQLRNEEQLRVFFQHLPGALLMVDRELGVLAASRRARELVGVDAARFPGPWRAALRRALAGETVRGGDDRLLLLDGRERVLRWEVHPWREADGAVGGAILVSEDVSERAAAEDRFRRAVLAAPFPIILHADDGEIVEINQVWTALTGYTREDLPTIARWTELAYGERAGLARGVIAPLYATSGITDQGEWRVRTARGDERIWQFSSAPLGHDARGRRLSISVAHDVTERNAARDALREGRERLAAALEASGTGTFRWDLHSGALEWDENLDRLFGLSPGQTARSLEAFIALVHPDDRAGVVEACRRCAELGDDFAREFRVVWPDGSIHWLDDRGKTFRDAAGNPAYMTGACVDVTEAKRAGAALRESEARLRELADAMPVIVWTGGPDGVTDYFNRRWYEQTGAGVGDGWDRHVHPDDVGRAGELWARSAATGEPLEVELRVRSVGPRGPVYRWHLARAVAARGADGAIARWYGTSTDIHDQREAAAKLREADRRKDEFLAMLAHELRNPLTPIRNAVEILRLVDSDPGGASATARGMIERQVGHMVRIVDDLLDVSRIARGKITLRKEPCDLTTLVRHAVDDHRGAFSAADIALEAQLPAAPVSVAGDATRLAQVLSNVLHNATKFTGRGGRVTVSLELDTTREAVIRVTDSGIGMEPDMLVRAFDAFSQADRSLDRGRGGLGLGLALVKGLVAMHGGSVAAESAGLGRGTTIVIRLPLPVRAAGSLPPPGGEADLTARLRVLLVEDNADAAESMRMLLELSGHEVAVAGDGTTAVEWARGERPHVILCDLGLPGELDGFGVARTVRADGELRDIRLVAVTGYGQEDDRRRSRDAGFDLHLVKPVDYGALSRWLAEVTRGRGEAP